MAEQLDYSAFAGRRYGLGGLRRGGNNATFARTFLFGSTKNALGIESHDYSDLNRIKRYTKRPPYSHYHQNGIDFLVLDTQDSSSSIQGSQLELFTQVTDTITSSYLIILHHNTNLNYCGRIKNPSF